jgi:hypothetical protein
VGGIGVREGTAVALLALVGVEAADAALLAFGGYLCAQPPALVGGLLGLVVRGRTPAKAPRGAAVGIPAAGAGSA